MGDIIGHQPIKQKDRATQRRTASVIIIELKLKLMISDLNFDIKRGQNSLGCERVLLSLSEDFDSSL